eukprot:Gregarina_sp_Poly_1__3587@NODE_204_length_11513_cov_91_076009_g182_i0_p5_GENE_NODE_204_length_11513_cov_91_076009_g182_i0NODE_204_length_11513_cov_91_076009_g182_i0_p5_ORF_typecomplete_len226_score17_97_NODE_204_length_11513_cov_91_076009_g182_i086749351
MFGGGRVGCHITPENNTLIRTDEKRMTSDGDTIETSMITFTGLMQPPPGCLLHGIGPISGAEYGTDAEQKCEVRGQLPDLNDLSSEELTVEKGKDGQVVEGVVVRLQSGIGHSLVCWWEASTIKVTAKGPLSGKRLERGDKAPVPAKDESSEGSFPPVSAEDGGAAESTRLEYDRSLDFFTCSTALLLSVAYNARGSTATISFKIQSNLITRFIIYPAHIILSLG